MTLDLEKKSIAERFQHLFALIRSERFLKKQGLGNEIPFFICPYPPEETVEMEKLQKQLLNQLEHSGVRVLEINLYDLSIHLLKERKIWEKILEIEKEISKDELKETLQGPLDSEQHMIPAIEQQMSQKDFEVMFLTGVGEVFPYIRSHSVLNNLQSKAKEHPTLMFFPGVYTQSPKNGASLDLFGRPSLHDDKYYRAFNIYHCEIGQRGMP